MTTVLIAVDDTDDAVETATTAHQLFGDGTDYLVVNVGRIDMPGMMWGTPYPVMGAALTYPPSWLHASGEARRTIEDTAEQRAADVVAEASVPDATVVGDAGDPVSTILRVGREHAVDVVVVGSHERSWFSRLLRGSVTDDIVRESEIPVLIVK